MSDVIVTVEGVAKRFVRQGHRPATLKTLFLHPREYLRGSDRFWALRDITFELREGETVGVIGANGSGKSTLLRLLGGIGSPTRGRIVRHRRVDAMLSLGETFDPLLTGRENAITAGIVSGESRKQVVGRLPEIAAFAELEEFLDLPLRTYSDGMRLRLAFAVAATTTAPDVLLIDEVLSVGDVRFQEKCMNRLEELQASGTAILLASHDEAQVRRLCRRALWLASGTIRADGSPNEVYADYKQAMRRETERRAAAAGHAPASDGGGADEGRFGTFEIEATSVAVEPASRRSGDTSPADPLRVEIELLPRAPVNEPIVGVTLLRASDGAKVLDVSTQSDGVTLGLVDGPIRLTLMLEQLDLEPGSYRFDVGVYERDWAYVYDYRVGAHAVEVAPSRRGGFGPPRRWVIGA